jgi:hypothetical protein
VQVERDRDVVDVRRALARDWLQLNSRAARNAAAAMRSDAQRAREREEALRALEDRSVPELRRA